MANKSENGRNRNLLKNNTTGFVGVSFKKSVNKYVARCSVNKARVHLGYFDTAVQASIAYENFAKTHHGVFYHKSTERINEHIT